MKCLVTGAYGFIGQAIVRALLEAGHEVVGAGRDVVLGRRLVPEIEWFRIDFNEPVAAIEWAEKLDGFDAVINAVGILQSDLRDKADYVHGRGAAALFKGAEAVSVQRVIHISATTIGDLTEEEGGALPQDLTVYAASKLAGERALQNLKLSSVIIRPDFVIGAQSSGGAMLLRGLAGLPFFTPVPGDGAQKFQPVAIDDLAALVVALLSHKRDFEGLVYAVGPEVKTIREMILAYRSWLRLPNSVVVRVPGFLMWLSAMFGDLSALLGNRGALRTASLEQMGQFEEHNPAPFAGLLGRSPITMDGYLSRSPSSLPDRLHARGYFWLPLLVLAVALTWIYEGYEQLAEVARQADIGTLALAGSMNWEGIAALLSIVAGVFFLSRQWRRIGGIIKMGLITIVGGLHFFYLTNFAQGVGLALSMVVPLLMIIFIMSLTEPR